MTQTIDTIRALLGRPNIRGYEARHGLETFAHVACAALGLPPVTVEWNAGIQSAAINKAGAMILSDIQDDAQVPRGTFVRWVGFVIHELLHRRYTDWSARDPRSYVDSLHNALEDAWIESRAIREGLLGNVAAVLGELVDGMTTEALRAVSDWSAVAQYPYSLAVYTRPHAGIKAPVPASLMPVWREASRRVAQAQSSHDTLAIARWVFDQLQKPSQEPDQKPSQKPSREPAPGQGSSKDGKPAQAPGRDGQDASQDAPDAGAAKAPIPHSMSYDTEPSMLGGGGAGFGPTGILPRAAVGSMDRWDGVAAIPGGLRYQVRRLLESSGREDLDSHRLAGSLDTRRLAASAWTPRVFARRIEEAGIDAAVIVLIDLSGSMSRSRAQIAVPAAMALMTTIEAAQASVLGAVFGNEVGPFKGWGEPVRRVAPQARRLMLAGGTNDWFALRWAHDQLLRHPAPRKIVISLTDGVGDPYKARTQIEAGSRLGIQTIGIGIQADVTGVYGHGAPRVQALADLGAVVFRQAAKAA